MYFSCYKYEHSRFHFSTLSLKFDLYMFVFHIIVIVKYYLNFLLNLIFIIYCSIADIHCFSFRYTDK